MKRRETQLRTRKLRALIKGRRWLNRLGLRKKKVFAIGFNKSGTSSIHALFRSLGLPSYHGVGWRSCDDLKLLRAYDCFTDGPPRDIAKLDRRFPDSKFILQVRELDTWIYSRLAHIQRQKERNKYRSGPLWDDTEEIVKSWIEQRNIYHLSVFSYFAARASDLLIVNFIRDGAAATKICRFLGYEGSYERPRENSNPKEHYPLKHVDMLNRCVEELGIPRIELGYDILCPSLISADLRHRFPTDTSLLADSRIPEAPVANSVTSADQAQTRPRVAFERRRSIPS